ncbi:hypothetical protein COLO4_14092 [Corchorus olitorius]|uniref:Uncharacterized protein n=1 Tax=Corchorus olitorius TaxID=93759 RepID=A0A1R3JTG7_9ROSI|nr:hypothetical protein COLO4_14092 [Corchorus olitorius]
MLLAAAHSIPRPNNVQLQVAARKVRSGNPNSGGGEEINMEVLVGHRLQVVGRRD